jgi:hypothetical protein
MIPDALIIASTAFADVTTRWAAFFDVDLGEARTAMGQIVRAALDSLPDSGKSGPVIVPGDELDSDTTMGASVDPRGPKEK